MRHLPSTLSFFMVMTMAFVSLASISCGRKGDDEEEPAEEETTGGAVDPEVRDVSGAFFLGDEQTPAAGYAVWLVDQTSGALITEYLSDEGEFIFELDDFTEGDVYSLHLIDPHFREVGAMDLSSLNSGTQAAFIYNGGYGFALGDIVVSLDDFGEINFSSPNLSGSVGGGFSLRTSTSVSLNTVPLPDSVPTFSIDSDLSVFDPGIILHSFYSRSENPEEFAQDLAAHSGVSSLVEGTKGAIADVFIEDTNDSGTWIEGARLGEDEQARPEDSPLWSSTSYRWTKKKNNFTAKVFTGRQLQPNSIIITTIRPTEGGQVRIPRSLSTIVTMIPKIKSIDLVAGGLGDVDYASATTENGLTRAFTLQSDDVALGALPPEDENGDSLGITTLPQIEVSFDYYTTKSGVDQLLTAVSADFPTAYRSAVSDTLDSGATREWDPSTRVVTITPDADPAAGEAHELSIWKELFLASAAGKTVKKIRLTIRFVSPDSSLSGATVVWFKKS